MSSCSMQKWKRESSHGETTINNSKNTAKSFGEKFFGAFLMAIYGVLLTKQVCNGIISFGKTYGKYES